MLLMFCSQLITYFVCSAQAGDDDDKSGEDNVAAEDLQSLVKKDPNLLGKFK
jgi:hypothetical protein